MIIRLFGHRMVVSKMSLCLVFMLIAVLSLIPAYLVKEDISSVSHFQNAERIIFKSPLSQPDATENKVSHEWHSIDSRVLPRWYDDAKFGIFIHWGVFSVPSVHDEWFWFAWKHHKNPDTLYLMDKEYKTGFSYPEFAPQFTAEFFNASDWAELFKASGARYVVLTSKHHEGYTLWPSKYSWNWNSVDVGPHRDIVGELSKAVRSVSKEIKFGVYYSLYEWYNRLYLSDKENDFKTDEYVKHKMIPELIDVVTKYHPDIVWADGAWDTDHRYWRSIHYLNWLYKHSPVKDTVVTNDRWGSDARCKHGGFYTCDDRFHPGKTIGHKWENCMTIDRKSWGYRRNAKLSDYFSTWELVKLLVETVSFGGNLLMNVGPTHDGMISVIYEERLREMGAWLLINGAAIYSTSPWTTTTDGEGTFIWYTASKPPLKYIYCIFLKWPESGDLAIKAIPYHSVVVTDVHLLGHGPIEASSISKQSEGIKINLGLNKVKPDVLKQPGWSLRFHAA